MKHLDFDSIANRMRNRALSGEHCGDGSPREFDYIKKCSVRGGSTTLVFTRDYGCHQFGWLDDPNHDRCWHLSIACIDVYERAAWLRAFFHEATKELWGLSSVTHFGQRREIWHWRLFCDARGNPIRVTNCADLQSAGMQTIEELSLVVTSFAA